MKTVWAGAIVLADLRVPVCLYSATQSAAPEFVQLHAPSGSRISLVPVVDGQPVDKAEIVRGYEYEKGHYIQFTEEEMSQVKMSPNIEVQVESIMPRHALPSLHAGSHYYIAPDERGEVASYLLLRDTLASDDASAIGQITIAGRERIIAILSDGLGLLGSLLHYDAETRSNEQVFEHLPPIGVSNPRNIHALRAVMASNRFVQPHAFRDTRAMRLRAMIDAKLAIKVEEDRKRRVQSLRASLAESENPPVPALPRKRRAKA